MGVHQIQMLPPECQLCIPMDFLPIGLSISKKIEQFFFLQNFKRSKSLENVPWKRLQSIVPKIAIDFWFQSTWFESYMFDTLFKLTRASGETLSSWFSARTLTESTQSTLIAYKTWSSGILSKTESERTLSLLLDRKLDELRIKSTNSLQDLKQRETIEPWLRNAFNFVTLQW
jgi:hypothetical protein